MAKLYKQMSTCRICKKRYEVVKDKASSTYMSSAYCSGCSSKYFSKRDDQK